MRAAGPFVSGLCAGTITSAAIWRRRRALRGIHVVRKALNHCTALLLGHVSHLAQWIVLTRELTRACQQ